MIFYCGKVCDLFVKVLRLFSGELYYASLLNVLIDIPGYVVYGTVPQISTGRLPGVFILPSHMKIDFIEF